MSDPTWPPRNTARALFRRAQRIVRSLPARASVRHERAAAWEAIERYPAIAAPRGHGLPGELIVSLTSYPTRYPTLAATLKSLLDQTVRADRLLLWIAHDDRAALTHDILALRDHGLEILTCEDIRSYKKILPAIERWPDAFIITVDDDVYYRPNWLEGFADAYDPACPEILFRRGHRPARDASGEMRPYQEWTWQVVDHRPSRTGLFPTGVGGVLYPPGSLSPEVTDRATAMALCSYGDDIWLYWMGRRAGATYRQIGPYFRSIEWEGSQVASLFSGNRQGRNDEQIRAMRARFGPV